MERKQLKRREHEKVRSGVGRYDCRQVFRHREVVNISTNPVLIVYVRTQSTKEENGRECARVERRSKISQR